MLILVTLLLSSSDITVFADNDPPAEKNTKLSEAFMTDQYGDFKLPSKYYEIDSVSDQDAKKLEENGIFEEIKDALFGWTDVGGKITDKFHYALNAMVNILFQFNVFMTKVMIICLEFGYDFKVIDNLIDELSKLMPSITGIQSGGLVGGGIFGNLMQIVVIITAVYTLYVYVVKRAFIASIGTIFKTVLLLTISFLLFSNYSTFLKTANGFSEEISSYIVASPSSQLVNESAPTLAKMKDTLWSMFVDRPYLYLQYGQHSVDEIGSNRIATLMQMRPGEDRYNYVLVNEVVGQGNTLMLNSSVTDKVAFTPFYLIINGLVSIPVYLLSILLVMLQFWFLIIAAISPFALLVGVIPGFSGVTKRYFIELIVPLALKVFFSFFTLFVLILSQLLYELDFNRTNDIVSYVGIGILEFILFITIFMLRKRIKDIFMSGSQIISGLRANAGSPSFIKKMAHTTTTLAGAAVGATVAGPQGAVMGASIGNTTGKVFTGDAGVGDIASTAASNAKYAQFRARNAKKQSANTMDATNKQTIKDFLKNKGFDEETVDDTISQFEKNNMTDITEDELNNQIDDLSEKVKSSDLEKDFATDFVSGIKDKRATDKMQEQLKILKNNNVSTEDLHHDSSKDIGKQFNPTKEQTKNHHNSFSTAKLDDEKQEEMKQNKHSITSENAMRLFHNKGIDVSSHEMMTNIVQSLENKGLHDVSMHEMEQQYNKLEQQYHNGTLNKDFAKAFTQGVINERSNEDIHNQNRKIFKNDIAQNIQPFETTNHTTHTTSTPITTSTIQPSHVNTIPHRNTSDVSHYANQDYPNINSNSTFEEPTKLTPIQSNTNFDNSQLPTEPFIKSANEKTNHNPMMESNSLENTTMESSSMNSSFIENSPLNKPSYRVRDTHRKNIYTEAQKAWAEVKKEKNIADNVSVNERTQDE